MSRVVIVIAMLLGSVARGGPAEDELQRRERAFATKTGAAQVVSLLEASELDDRLFDGGASLIAFVQRATQAKDPLVAAQARWLLDSLEQRRGRPRTSDVVDHAILVGPFTNDAGAQLTTAPIADEAKLLTGELKIGRAIDGEGALPLGVFARPDMNVVAYVVVPFRADRAMELAVRIGSTGAHVVWVDGVKLGSRVGDRALWLDADAYGVQLAAGAHRLVVRIAVGDRQPELLVRLTDPKGNAASGLTFDASRDAVRGKPTRTKVPTLQSELTGLDRDEYVLLSGLDGPHPDEVCGKLSAPTSRRIVGMLLSCAPDADVRRRVIEARLQLATDEKEKIWLHTLLGEGALRGRTIQLGEDELRGPGSAGSIGDTWRARLRLAELDADRGLQALADRAMDALVREAPARRVREARALLALRAGRHAEAIADYRALVDELPGDVGSLRQLASQLRGSDLAAALKLLDREVMLRDREAVAIERAELEQGLGHVDRAEAELGSIAKTTPDDPRLEERIGRLLLSADRRGEALPHLRRALQLRPQSPELRSLVADLDGTRDLARLYGVDLVALRAQAAQDPLGRDDPARVLYDGATVHVHDNGLQETYVERVIEIGDRRGAQREGEVAIRYSPDSQGVEVRAARVYKADGEVVEAASVDERDVSEPWYSIYYDERAQVVTLPALEPRDVIYVAYTISDHGRRNQLGESFCDLHMLQEEMVRLTSRYRLVAPRARALHFNEPHADGRVVAPTIHDDGDERTYDFVVRDAPKIAPEENMPGPTELGAYVHASTFASWAEVIGFYRGLIAPQLEPDAAIRDAAREAVQGKTSVEEKVAAIYDLVLRSTRYVGLEFGVHGYQPYAVTQIWQRRFGDCKDKASLLVVMLHEVGIDASLVLLRTRREGMIDASPASLAPFDHAIAYVPALDRYLDGTTEFSGSKELPTDDQGAMALHVSDGVLHTTPTFGPEGSRTDTTLDVELARDGSAEVTEHRVIAGSAAEAARRRYEAPDLRKERLGKVWAARSPGAIVRSIELPHLDDRERPVELIAKLHLPRLARGDRLLVLPVLLREPQLLQAYARLGARTHDLELSSALHEVERVTVKLAGATPMPMVQSRIETPFGRFELRVTVDGDTARVESELVLSVRRVAVKDYPAFRAFLSGIDRAVAGELLFEVKK